jgi:hypothetical protein
MLHFIHFYLVLLYMHALNIDFDGRNNASKKTNHQEISESIEAKRSRCRRRLFPSGRKTIGIYFKDDAHHQDINQGGFHSAFGLWRHRGYNRDQGSTPALGRNFLEDQAGIIPLIYPAQ